MPCVRSIAHSESDMANEHITSAEFARAIEALRDDNTALREELRAGLSGVNARLDKVNGRLDRHEDAIGGRDGSRIKHLEREVFTPKPTAPGQIPPCADHMAAVVAQALQAALAAADGQPLVTVGQAKRAKALVAALWSTGVALAGTIAWIIAHWPKG